MNRAVANVLKGALTGMPVIDKIAGLVQVAEFQDTTYDESGQVPTTKIVRLPWSCDVSLEACDQMDLVPDDSKRGIIYFENNGTTSATMEGDYMRYRSRLRLVCWYNSRHIQGNSCFEVTPILITDIIKRLHGLNFINHGNILKMQVNVEGIPPQDKTLFANYTYDLYNTQYLMPPFDCFGIDLSVEFLMHPKCINALVLNENPDQC